MRTIIIKTQKDLDNYTEIKEPTYVIIRSNEIIFVKKLYNNSTVNAYDNSTVYAYNNLKVNSYDNSTVNAYDNSTVYAYDNSTVYAYNNLKVNSYDNSTVNACNNSTVNACDNSTVNAYSNSTVNAYDNSTVNACNNSTVNACDNSKVYACDNSKVYACNNSTVNAYLTSVCHNYSSCSTIDAYDNSIIFLHKNTKNINVNNKTVKVIKKIVEPTFEQWLERGIVFADGIYNKLISTKQLNDKIVYMTDAGFVVKQGDKFSHGKTLKEAVNDLIYKISNRDTSKFKNWTLDTKVTKEQAIQAYRVITGACAMGTKNFVEKCQTIKEDMDIKYVIKITEGQYGNTEFKQFFKGE